MNTQNPTQENAAAHVRGQVALYLRFNAGVTDKKALALGLAEFLEQTFNVPTQELIAKAPRVAVNKAHRLYDAVIKSPGNCVLANGNLYVKVNTRYQPSNATVLQ